MDIHLNDLLINELLLLRGLGLQGERDMIELIFMEI